MIHIYIHYPTLTEAKRISGLLLKKRLAACVSFIRQSDMYWWHGKIVKTNGVVAFAVALKKNYQVIEKLVAKHHSYEVPCILELPIGRAYKPYEGWLKRETSKK